MIHAYDKTVKKHIQSFLIVSNGKKKRQIPVFGLQDEGDDDDSLIITQAAGKTDKLILPMVGVFRRPRIEITDDAMTKRPSNYDGYIILDGQQKQVQLNSMRCTLEYAINVYAETKKETEDIMIQLFFRLRNNPQIITHLMLPVKNEDDEYIAPTCITDITMLPAITHVVAQKLENMQMYKLTSGFLLKNVNLYDFIEREFQEIEYEIVAKLKESKS